MGKSFGKAVYEDFDISKPIAPRDTNEQKAALQTNAYFNRLSGHTFFDRYLSGVDVTLSSERLGDTKLQSVSDVEGQYDFPSLVAGDYTVTVEFSLVNEQQDFVKY